MANQPAYQSAFAGNINLTVGRALKIFAKYPASAGAFTRLGAALRRAEKARAKEAEQGLETPPLLIISTTEACNLTCAGCYACAKPKQAETALSPERAQALLDEAEQIGVSVVMLAGGEPLLCPQWLEALGDHPDLLGVLFTNGTLIGADTVAWLGAHRHIIPTLSVEGDAAQTDARRGAGIHAQVAAAMATLHQQGVPFGISVTVTAENMATVLTDAYIKSYVDKGCVLAVFVEYVPVAPGSEPLVLSAAQKKQLNDFSERAMGKFPVICVPFPGNEELYGGCLAAGRGFVHISASGAVEPCPFAPFSDANLAQATLREALQSQFLAAVRTQHHLLKEGEGGCALWRNKEWLNGLLPKEVTR